MIAPLRLFQYFTRFIPLTLKTFLQLNYMENYINKNSVMNNFLFHLKSFDLVSFFGEKLLKFMRVIFDVSTAQ